jgi:hypothetical protein
VPAIGNILANFICDPCNVPCDCCFGCCAPVIDGCCSAICCPCNFCGGDGPCMDSGCEVIGACCSDLDGAAGAACECACFPCLGECCKGCGDCGDCGDCCCE